MKAQAQARSETAKNHYAFIMFFQKKKIQVDANETWNRRDTMHSCISWTALFTHIHKAFWADWESRTIENDFVPPGAPTTKALARQTAFIEDSCV